MAAMHRTPRAPDGSPPINRRDAIAALSALSLAGMATLASAHAALASLAPRDRRMPALFVGHGSPMNAIADTPWARRWAEVGARLDRPSAIVCVSAHWETPGVRVTAMREPRTIHDFSGFPDALHSAVYPAPGSPELARATAETVKSAMVGLDWSWGLDHGTWSVLARMFPKADVPVVQLSLDETQGAAAHWALARELRPLRDRGVLVIGSGNIVHNLRRADRRLGDAGFDWALEFDAKITALIDAGDHRGLIEYERLGRAAQLSVPTREHYLPLLYALGARHDAEPIAYFNDGPTMGSISMRSLIVG
jgi:4,5-DOPA dioxygenase extradiol